MEIFHIIQAFLFVGVYGLVESSINVTRGTKDNVYDPSVSGDCNVRYRANYNASLNFCKCSQHKKSTFYSIKEGESPKCEEFTSKETGLFCQM